MRLTTGRVIVLSGLFTGTSALSAQSPIARFEQRLEELRGGYGIADLATGRPAADSTVYHLASITKPIASTVLHQLVEEGKVSLDRNALLKPETKALAWTPVVTSSGDTLPYALGWFSTRYKGVRVVWQYGLWTAISSLILKVSDRELTLVLLANSDGLSAPYRLGGGRLELSPWGQEFLDRLVIGTDQLP